jgi:YNFM family putative membrane transporter
MSQTPETGLERGSRDFRRASLALFLAGCSTFSLLYCVQPLLPIFASEFSVSPADSALPLSLSTGMLAVAILCAAVASEGFGRRGLMFVSMMLASLFTVLAAASPDWTMLLVLRAATGFLLGGVPAVAMTWLAEEMDKRSAAYAMGLYVAGTAFGGMLGRVGAGILADYIGWRWAMGVAGLAGLLAAAGFMLLLPRSRNFRRSSNMSPATHLRAWMSHVRTTGLPPIVLIAFMTMGAFITVLNYAAFRLLAPPFELSQAQIGLIFLVYIFGIASSSFTGPMIERFGRPLVLPAGLATMAAGIGLTLMPQLGFVIGGIILLTVGFFFSHSVASSAVGLFAKQAKGHAASLYHLSYYAGSSLAGWIGGWFFALGHWPAVVVFTLCLLGLAFVAAFRIRALPD